MKTEDILREWAKDCEIDRAKLGEESLDTARLHAKYLQFHSAIKILIAKKKAQRDKLFHEKKEWVTGRMTKEQMDLRGWEYDPFQGAKKPLKTEADAFVKVDPDIQKLQQELENLRITESALLDIMNHINWRHTHIRNYIDWEKFTAGG